MTVRILKQQYRKRYAVRHVTLSEAKRPGSPYHGRDASLRSAWQRDFCSMTRFQVRGFRFQIERIRMPHSGLNC